MNSKKFSEAMSEVDTKYVDETLSYKKKSKQPLWIKWGAIAACLCPMLVGGVMFLHNRNSIAPNPSPVQDPNPIIEVTTVEEMKQYLDFDVPVLEKEIETYSVLVLNKYPTMGQIIYSDGSRFRIQYGSGDISGIYGGTLEESKDIDGVKVDYYKYKDISYAIWEQNDFAFSYEYTNNGEAEVEALIQQWK